jgi:SAM-dependent methyltransferase
MSVPDRSAFSERVLRHFADRYGRRTALGGTYKMTSRGAWATSRPEAVLHFFHELGLDRYRLFGDLGCGDGVAVCVAALFTHAVGIEADPDLSRHARENARALGLLHRTAFICGDFLDLRLDPFDVLYIYPDKPLDSLTAKLHGWSGILLVYGPHFPPHGWPLLRRCAWEWETLSVYAWGEKLPEHVLAEKSQVC